jgi:meiotically up-regulated gene 157 (Mug157) protein
MNRRRFVRQASLATTALLLSKYTTALAKDKSFPIVRTPEGQRKFKSKAVEAMIAEITQNIGNKELAWLFGNCFPNTLDTTVDYGVIDGGPDTYVITGDIDAMWLRDSSAQVWPYLPLCKKDKELQQMIKGVINRQTRCILKDPYANAFYKDEYKKSEWGNDDTRMQPGIHERKWEIDSLCYPIRLAHGYWEATGDISVFGAPWVTAMEQVVNTFIAQQRFDSKGPYSFMRETKFATDSVPLGGYGYPARPNGLICSMFRPSDDATIYPYLIPANLFAFASLGQLATLMAVSKQVFDTNPVRKLMDQIIAGIDNDAKIRTKNNKEIYAYEVNGYGSYNLMDDANVPSLLSLAYLIPGMKDDPVYHNTRRFVLSGDNPFFFKGKAGEGIGGPHVGMDYIWPISIIMRGITSTDDAEIKTCLGMLQKSHAGTGFMHESFHKDDVSKYTRKWFAWANTLFGEFIWKVYREKPYLLNA